MKKIFILIIVLIIGIGIFYFYSKIKKSEIIFKELGDELVVFIDENNGQTFKLDSNAEEIYKKINEGSYVKKFITDLDVNFDGQNDIGVFVSTGYMGVNNYYDFYVYNPETKTFEGNKQLSSVSNPSVKKESNEILSSFRSGANWYTDVYFYRGDNKFSFTEDPSLKENVLNYEEKTKYPINSEPIGGKYNNDLFSFEYPKDWYLYELKEGNSFNSVFLLKKEELKPLGTESYSLGDQIHISKRDISQSWESAQKYLDTNDFSGGDYEGKATSITKEVIKGLEFTRVQHTEEGYQQTLTYHYAKGPYLYSIYLFPYKNMTEEDLQNFNDFVVILNSLEIK